MPKQLNVNLGFTADTSQAKAQLQDLQKQLTNLINNPKATSSIGLTKEIQEASVAAATLKTQLQEATNVNTGKLDLGKLSQSLKQSGYEIKDYKNALLSLGPEGQQAFATLAQSISLAEVPLRRSNALLAEFSTALKNTTRWQISSSVVHGFMGSVQSAYRYAQDLNESLNNIRIVTGQTTDQMADFAKQANASAKALSTTTTAYTDAALIFYQQGLTGDEVTERTDTVIKMANVTGQSAEEVSSYMTAIWNNFYDGSESLEHYADVITALGASTASSSEEIAEGLSKFASVADTIGLSYDYATSILAALVANTRQSADVIGTSLKTILARLQSVKLGETLEDGVELTKYTSALDAIGVSVLDLNGNLRDADDILKDTAKKWDTLTNAQQAAVAQTVAGTRQYAQFIAMMENWGDVELNLATAEGADDSLQDQADIYAESWEAASKRVKASAQDIYDSLLNDKFFIGLNNVFAGLLDTIGGVIDGLGGMKGVLLAVGSIFLKVYRNQAAEALQNVQYSFMMMTKTGREEVQKLRAETNKELKTLFSDDASVKGNMMGEAYVTQASVQEELLNKAKGMTKEQQKIAQILLDQHTALVQNVAEQEKLVEKAEEEANLAMRKANSSAGRIKTDEGQDIKDLAKLTKEANAFEAAIDKAFGKFDTAKMADGTKQAKAQIDQLKQQVKSLNAAFKEPEEIVEAFGDKGAKAFKQFEKEIETAADDPQKLEEALNKLFAACNDSKEEAQALGVELKKLAGEGTDAEAGINAVEQSAASAGQEFGVMASQMVDVETSAEGFGNKLNQIPPAINKTLQGLVQIGQALSTVAMAVSSVSSLVETWKGVMEGTVEPGQAVIQTLTTLGFVVPMLITSFNSLNMAEYSSVVASMAAALGFTGTATAAEAAAAGTATFGTVLYTVLWPIGLVTAAIGLLIGTVWLLVKAFKAITSNPVEEKLKKAEEQAQQSAEAFDRVAESVKGVKDKLDELAESYDTIDQLKKGTDEWYEAVQNVNYEVSKLLDKYPDLSKYIYNDNGLLRISQKGIDSVNQKLNERLQTANNIKLNDQRVENETKMDANWGYLGSDEQAIASVAQQYYNNPQGGDMVFTREAAEDITDVLFGSLEDYTAGYDDEYRHYGEEDYNEIVDLVKKFINKNDEVLKSNKQLADANQQIIDTQLAAKMSIFGSNRTTEQTKELLDENAYQGAMDRANEKVKSHFKDWNFSVNYDENDTDEWKDIQKFMELQGDDVEYVAQRWGKMVLKIGEEEKEFTKEQVYNALAEAYSNEELKTMVHQKLQKNLGQVLTNVDMGSLNTDTLINLDNLHLQLEQALSNIDSDSVDAVFDKIVTSAGTSTDAIESMANKFNSIDWGNVENIRKFNAAAHELESGKMTIDEFTYAIDKMVAATKLEGMDDFFKNAADSLGLKEEDAAMMKEYARNLMEFSEEEGGVSKQLATNADSAADLAVELYRMNKGIDALADGFEDWNDIITKSNKESQEYSEAMYHMKQALSDVLDVESDLISSSFVENHLAEIKKAADGDADAIDALRASMDEEIIANITVGQSDDFIANVMEAQNDLNDLIANMDIDDIEVGAIIDDKEFLDAANNLVNSASMTADEANAYFAGIGYEPVYSTEDIENANSMQVPNATTTTQIDFSTPASFDIVDPFGNSHTVKLPLPTVSTISKDEGPTNAQADMRLTAFSGDSRNLPQIKGMRKKATGSQNNYSSSNSGGKSPGKSKSGGGKAPEHKTKNNVNKFEADPFHKVNQELEDVEHNLSLISKEQSHLAGGQLISSLKQQNKLLKQQEDLHKKKAQIAKNEAATLRESLKAQGVAFDGDNIANYNAMLQAAENQINALINQYNALSAAEQEAWDKAAKDGNDPIKQAENYYESLKKDMDAYTKYMSTVYSEEEAHIDALYEQIENKLKAWDAKIQIKLDLKEAQRELNDFLAEINQSAKDLYSRFENIGNKMALIVKDAKTYTGKNGTIQTDIKDLNHAEEFIDKAKPLEKKINSGKATDKEKKDYENLQKTYGFGSTSEAAEKIGELNKRLQKDALELKGKWEDAWDAYLEGIDQSIDKYDEIRKQYDDIDDELDHQAKMLELLRGQNDFDIKNEIYETQMQNDLSRMSSLKEWGDMAKAQYSDAVKKYGANSEAAKKWKDEWKNTMKELHDTEEKYLEDIQKKRDNAIQKSLDSMKKQIAGGQDFDWINEQWDMAREKSNGYYDSVEKIYEIEKMESKWEAALNKTDSIKNQQKLKAIMDSQLANLKDKTELSEYDIGLAERELKIAEAQIALEEAQSNKNSMKLTRDQSGNWSYQYVADQTDVEEKQQALLDANYDKYEFIKKANEDAYDSILKLYSEMFGRMEEIIEAYNNGTIKSWDDAERRINEIKDNYLGDNGIIVKAWDLTNLTEQNLNIATFQSLDMLYKQDSENYKLMTDAEKALMDGLHNGTIASAEDIQKQCAIINEQNLTSWQGMCKEMMKAWNDDNGSSVKGAVNAAIGNITAAQKQYELDVNAGCKAVGKDYKDVSKNVEKIGKEIDKLGSKTKTLVDKTKTNMEKYNGYLAKVKNAWTSVKKEIEEATKKADAYYKAIKKGKNSKPSSANTNGGGSGGNTGSGGGSGNANSGGTGGGSGGDGNITVGEIVTYTGGLYYADEDGNGKTGSRGPGKKVTVTKIAEGHPYPIHVKSSDSAYGWLKKEQLSGYDTGGYTGDWAGGDGRLALLHHKELVLNAEDTENILDAVQLIRKIATKDLTQTIGESIKNGINNLIGSILNLKNNEYNGINTNNNEKEENVTTINVEAVFPNASGIEEIREAILSLPNYASQVKMRK